MGTRIIVFTDLHANLPALEALIKQITSMGYDAIFHTGDAIAIGPYPQECLDVLLNIPRAYFVMGNHDALFVDGLPQVPTASISNGEFNHQLWTHSAINPKLRSIVALWPYELQLDFEGVKTSFVHYGLLPSRRDFVQVIQHPSAAHLDQMFDEFQSDIVFYGHHHPFSDIQGQARYVNPGSAGCHSEAIARYCVVEFQRGEYTLEHYCVNYADRDLFQAFETRQVPEREFIYKVFFGDRFRVS